MVSTLPLIVDRLVVHQFDPARSSPGGIDTCLRGIGKYSPLSVRLAFVGVDTGAGPDSRQLGVWEQIWLGDRSIWFLPVVKLDPANYSRKIPHSLLLILGVWKFRSRMPSRKLVQAHRMDTALALKFVLPAEQAYFIHTQENGLTGKTSDSIWRWAGGLHKGFEKFVVRSASVVSVFNQGYATKVKTWNAEARFSPTWFDPELVHAAAPNRDVHRILWVGRLEIPKDANLAILAFEKLIQDAPDRPWSLQILGSGTQINDLTDLIAGMTSDVRKRVKLLGRIEPIEVGRLMAEGGIFLMTSHAGYEGYPRVLVEAMASGLVPVVTFGSDTGGLVIEGETGFVTDREPASLADSIVKTISISRQTVANRVANLNASSVISLLFEPKVPAPEPRSQ